MGGLAGGYGHLLLLWDGYMKTLALLLSLQLMNSCILGKAQESGLSESGGGSRLCYEPCVVKLTGQLVTAEEFGPPNFGENPDTDSKVVIYLLKLQKPISVRNDPQSRINVDSLENVKEIQLEFSRPLQDYRRFLKKNIIVRGKLFEAHTGHHYRKVLMSVDHIEGL